jgi:hypothetical protein
MDAHVLEYYDYIDAMADLAANEQMKHDEGIWEDNGCQWPT